VQWDSSDWRGVYLVKWAHLRAASAVGKPFACPSYPIKSVHVTGTFGGATVTMQGSNIGTTPTYAALTTDGTTACSVATSEAIKNVWENTYYVRPSVASGGGTTDLTVYLLCVTER